MYIKRIRLENFKSFKKTKVTLNPFNIIIGANASGKSNFVQLFKFLKDILKDGLANAVSMQGGVEYLKYIDQKEPEDIVIELDFENVGSSFSENMTPQHVSGRIEKMTYRLRINTQRDKIDYNSLKEELVCSSDLWSQEDKQKQPLINSKIVIKKDFDNITTELIRYDGVRQNFNELFPMHFPDVDVLSKHTLLETTYFMGITINDWIKRSEIFNIEPKLSKQEVPIEGKVNLESNARNLSQVVNNILKDNKKREKLLNTINYLLSTVDDIKIEKMANSRAFLQIKESYFQEKYMPANMISDGTMQIIALVVAAQFSEVSLRIFEEPDNSIHPKLVSKIVEMMKNASNAFNQFIVTTHNPEMLRYAEPKDIILITRDDNGFSKITRPANKDQIKTFMKNNIGLSDLFADDML